MVRLLLVQLLLVFTFSLGNSQEIWSLEKCVDTALKSNLRLKGAALNTENSSVALRQAENQRYPSLSTGTNAFLNLGRSIDPTSNQFVQTTFLANNFSVNTGVLIYNGGRLQNNIKQAGLDAKSTVLTEEQIKRDIILEVSTNYLNALLTKENISLSRNRIVQTQQQLEFIRGLINYGARPENEVFELEAQIATDEQAIIQAQNNYELALLRLKQVMNVNINLPLDVDVKITMDGLTDPISVDLNDLYNRGQANQISLKAREINVEAAEIGIKIAKAGYYPTISFGGNITTNISNKGVKIDGYTTQVFNQRAVINNQIVDFGLEREIPIVSTANYFNQFNSNLGYGFGLNVNIPIYSNYNVTSNVERARLRAEQAKIDLNQEKQIVQSNVTQAYVDAKASKATFLATEKSLEAQKKAFEVAKKRYEAGTINNFDFTQQKTRVDIAEINYLNAKYDYIFRTKVLDFYLGKTIKL
ncbi:MAG TPA: TolC family protein [Saprospiraceae bacterium]|nr:TolC family protein [Saprospiraceae bacterium]